MAAPRRDDWSETERLYRDGVLSIRAIADQQGVTEAAIRKEAKKQGWVRSDAHKVREMAKKLVADRTVPVYAEPGEARVDTLAKVAADILEAHRRRFARLSRIADAQLEQLEEVTLQEREMAGQIETYFLAKAAEDPLGAAQHRRDMNRALHAIGLGSRAKTLVDLVNATSRLTDLERQSFSLDENEVHRSYEDVLAEIHAKREAA